MLLVIIITIIVMAVVIRIVIVIASNCYYYYRYCSCVILFFGIIVVVIVIVCYCTTLSLSCSERTFTLSSVLLRKDNADSGDKIYSRKINAFPVGGNIPVPDESPVRDGIELAVFVLAVAKQLDVFV